MRITRWLLLLAILNVKGCHLGQTKLQAAGPGELGTNGILLMWDYPTNALSTNQVLFKVYSTTNLAVPLLNWPLIKAVGSTNRTLVGTNWSFITPIPMQPEARYFFMTASNFWGEANPSNVAATPAAPRSDVSLSIGLAP